ncbi:MAG: dTDP-4-dehydrorhamnose reductase [Lachnospiraceae bacterium]|nr:dTDP-4-dehydrorhamnose reductase [Lachnospiraceae bacterium]
MRVFVTGVNGQLGHDVMNELSARGRECIGSGSSPKYNGIDDGSAAARARYAALDITNAEAVADILDIIRPDAIVHCASWTAVDLAEDEANRDRVFAINADGTRNLATAAKKYGSKLIYVSTDYVFDGSGDTPRLPDDTGFGPLNVYGRSKLDGEEAVRELVEKYYIVRTSWAFGLNGNNFIKNIIRASKTGNELRVVNDQIGTPTYTKDLSVLLADMTESDRYGCYHATNEGGYISWYDLAVEIFRQCGIDTKLVPVSTAEYGLSKARRPLNSRLDRSKLAEEGFKPLPDWKDALTRYLKEEGYIDQ